MAKRGTWCEGLSCADELNPGKVASARTKELAPLATKVAVEAHERDCYGRPLGYVTLPDDTALGLQLVREGLCKD